MERKRKVSESGMVVILREEDPLTAASSVRLEDLEGHPIVELSDDEFSNRVTRSMLKKNKVRYTDCYSAGDLEMVPSLIRKKGDFTLPVKAVSDKMVPELYTFL